MEEGDGVLAGGTAGLIEVMKNLHEVKGEEDGMISKYVNENEEAVDAGQDLVELEYSSFAINCSSEPRNRNAGYKVRMKE